MELRVSAGKGLTEYPADFRIDSCYSCALLCEVVSCSVCLSLYIYIQIDDTSIHICQI